MVGDRPPLLNDRLADPRFSKDRHGWNAIRRGEISADWPLTGMVKGTDTIIADGPEHRTRPDTRLPAGGWDGLYNTLTGMIRQISP
ncbi:cytochrome P450 [Streptomyces sp. NBC_01471]|uniref:hypothetical protein n=1 Tax=Streptomyces sp. NBC_01471 TaxID=2903879 RepID=UPI0032525E47